MNTENIFVLGYAFALLVGVVIGFIYGINDQKKEERKRYDWLVNSAMTNAYQAGFIDGENKGKKRPSGNGGK
jgi:energy-converting hydrogenase Eha subunit A